MNKDARIRFGILRAMLLLFIGAACAAGANLGAQSSNPSRDAGDAGSFGADTSFGLSDGGGSPGCSTCSTDLHQVLDCNQPPNVIRTCPDDQACGANDGDRQRDPAHV